MKLSKLLSVLADKKITGSQDPEIAGVVYDPLRVKPGFLYVAIDIYTQLDKIEIPDGHPFVNDAIKAGAVAVMLQNDMPVPDNIVKIVVPSSRRALALVAGEFYNHPSRKFKLIGITGTNGKTTTTHIIESIMMTKYRVGLIGTLYYKINGRICKSKDTTPEPPDLQEIFTHMLEEKLDYCAMEVSSHGVEFFRVAGIDYEAGIWTNFTQDHLDFHITMDEYRNAKLKWVKTLNEDKFMAVNMDDPSADYFIKAARAKVVRYGLKNPSDVTAKDYVLHAGGTDFRLVTPKGEIDIKAKLRGEFNLYNMLGAVAGILNQPITLEEIKTGLEKNIVVAGRFQPVERGQKFSVIIDYAHTPDGMEKVMNAARAMNPSRIITVFGCGGDRDRSKRPQMAAIVEANCDYFIITEDNPRTEDPSQIMNDIVAGVKNQKSENFEIVYDRYEAIKRAIEIAKPGDLVIVAGKGHESTQTLKDKTLHFNDYEVADEILQKMGYKG
ncbi:MAG TPA: UDP-N-acetylmuramoyl-L-alanyl-D-glutamate--2,6-diaminopimelate ligase [Candidatus Sumerlaeota bacterium]|nr:MAG: UDP-N-acetylmuramoyl-L-alanyl-D-glutamate--L-lysine ligase [candidate division BRC1 bacterium ADurb.Bin183]HOE62933.1 UDP-N-acetylmuramoyl-L-alanyl-D-glutamate--2,6-diaminopimelate ligase [Candidatus Sumerlaeota bacterium]HRR31877.1 UDP-N-acetylmuramoyl-L-alanyl-D-glutamate--2,6-diaminopimelate ligase [Candidatus Sumerlaeia bacterium]HON50282.1 UDP-N-acetylmuramoyl-L-alanyl-D-glutamate--2,6-diaminopimelate ligase [Candidatus Sumerlaeota bacterium]HOR63498.1 UDP-N-acetylmuramoyl-L-alanyl